MLKGSHYQEALKESIEDMKVQALRVREEASVCMQRDMANLNHKIDTRARQGIISHCVFVQHGKTNMEVKNNSATH